ncbi:hypothetical protein IPC412_18805 [Pseudomonas aeruginosa]|uniref:hypothetical protein n=1 Tax=Pseudomonas aeruginosa TaxID=287 RepID=UPI000FC40639|nr:hypothetical protein [Pseudomonas aeruginosa]RUI81678.1 hypothetical protein IPC412_18805 [Pseudomonas aeruginosa]RUJ32308.1 hypothetical protein IPC357_18160 [Pseudomonas aeruginosa]
MRGKLKGIGLWSTVVYFLILVCLIWYRSPTLLKIPLNELGDFCAGIFGPLAILWLILGFMQQGEELRLNNEALKLQATELRNSVQQQTAMAEGQEKSLRNYERSLEPLLKLELARNTQIEGDEYLSFQLSNLGEYCEKVEVMFTGHSAPYKYDTLFGGERIGFFVFAGDIEYDRVYSVDVSYLNRCGNSGCQSFTFVETGGPEGGCSVKKRAFLNS